MAIAREAFYMLCRLQSVYNFKEASLITLGRQSGIVTFRQIKSISKRLGRNFEYQHNAKGIDNFYRNTPTGDEIFNMLGFTKIDSLDSNDFENATLIHDLNIPIPMNFSEQYDVVFDGGTTEHIFDQLGALKNIHNLTKVGGLIIHYTPANNYLDHGYFQPSPSFYYEYYLANGFEIVDSFLISATYDFYRKRKVFEYKPLLYENLSYGGWGNKMMGNWFAVKKLSSSTSGLIPQQQRYVNYFHIYNKPESSKNRIYLYFISFFKRHPDFKFYVLQTKHWGLKIFKIRKYLFKPRSPKPLFYA